MGNEPRESPHSKAEDNEQYPLDPVSFAQALSILQARFQTTGAELAMWISHRDLLAFRAPGWEFNFSEDEKPATADAAAQMLMTLGVRVGASMVAAFEPPERYLDYAGVLRRIDERAAAAEAMAIQQEWGRIHAKIVKQHHVGAMPMVAAVVPGSGYAQRMEDGLFFEDEIDKFLELRISKAPPPQPHGIGPAAGVSPDAKPRVPVSRAPAPAPPVVTKTPQAAQDWALKKPTRLDELNAEIFRILSALKSAGKAEPRALDVVAALKVARPACIATFVKDGKGGVLWVNQQGVTKHSDLRNIRERIQGLTAR